MSCPATEIASAATRKNQPPDIDIIMFHNRPGTANGSSSRQKRCQPDRRNTRDASLSSGGTVRIDWYRLNAMFHACDVKIAKIAAHSTPSRLPGNNAMNGAIAIAWKPRIGTDCRISSSGIITFSAALYFAAIAANTKLNSSAQANAVHKRKLAQRRE